MCSLGPGRQVAFVVGVVSGYAAVVYLSATGGFSSGAVAVTWQQLPSMGGFFHSTPLHSTPSFLLWQCRILSIQSDVFKIKLTQREYFRFADGRTLKPVISMISGFSAVSKIPKSNIIEIWGPQGISINPREIQKHFRRIFVAISKCGKLELLEMLEKTGTGNP